MPDNISMSPIGFGPLSLQPPTSNEGKDYVTFKTVGKGSAESGGNLLGNAAFIDAIADAQTPEQVLAVLNQYKIPLDAEQNIEAFIKSVLQNLQANDPEIVPDTTLMNSALSLQEGSATMNMSNLGKMQATYGTEFVKAAVAQGKDPAEIAAKILGALANITPPVTNLSEEERNQILLHILLSEGSENAPVPIPNPATKAIFEKVKAQLNATPNWSEGSQPAEGGKLAAFDPTRSPGEKAAVHGQQFINGSMGAVQEKFGQEFVKKALAEGKDPTFVVAALETALNEITPPVVDLPEGDKLQILLQLISTDNKAGVPVSINDSKVKAIFEKVRTQMALKESQEDTAEKQNSGVFPQAKTLAQIAEIYGKEFVDAAFAKGEGPQSFLSNAQKMAMSLKIDPPLSTLTHTQRVRLLFRILMASTSETGGSVVGGQDISGLSKLNGPQKKLLKQMIAALQGEFPGVNISLNKPLLSAFGALSEQDRIAAAGTKDSSQTSEVTKTVAAQVQNVATTLAGNPWLQPTALSILFDCLMVVTRKAMKMEQLQGAFTVSTMKMSIKFADIAKQYERKLAKIAIDQAMMGIVGAALSITMSAIGMGLSVGGRLNEVEVPQQKIYVPKENGGASFGGTPAGAKSNADSVNTGADSPAKTRIENSQNKLQQAKIEEEAAMTKQEGTSADDTAAMTKAKEATAKAKAKRMEAELELRTREDGLGIRQETDAEFKVRQEEAIANNKKSQTAQDYGQYMLMSGGQVSAMLSNIMTAINAEEEADVKGAKHILETVQQLITSMREKAIESRTAQAANIDAFLTALKEIAAAIQRAQAELIK